VRSLSEYLLELKNVSKSFGTNQVLFDVDFQLHAGEIHAIIGENGAGKSTLMNIADGLVKADSGEIIIEGQTVEINNPMDAQRNGICFVHQEIALCQDVSVAQNIFMSQINASKQGLVNYNDLATRAREILNTLVQDTIDPNALVMNLSIPNQQVVEIAKALSTEPKILILDEPTASLTEAETEALYDIMHKLTARGIGIIYISHRMSEIFDQCDRVSVLRDGYMVARYDVADVKVQQLVNDMAGREVNAIYPGKAENITRKAENVMLSVKGLADEAGLFEDISFDLYRGEMLGFYGLIGSGRSEIMQGITGLRRLKRGEVIYNGSNIVGQSPKKIFGEGLLYMSEDRKVSGLFLEMNLMYNISAMHLEQINERGIINTTKEKEQAERMSAEMNIKATGIGQLLMNLSGGNQQKALLAKLLVKKPEVVILDEPTRGIDVAAKAEIHRLLRRLVDDGIGVIIVSSELNEIIGMCDRVAVVYEGEIVDEANGEEINSNHIVYYATGAFRLEDEKEKGGTSA
jgi:ribose transport system ATP-binding protein